MVPFRNGISFPIGGHPGLQLTSALSLSSSPSSPPPLPLPFSSTAPTLEILFKCDHLFTAVSLIPRTLCGQSSCGVRVAEWEGTRRVPASTGCLPLNTGPQASSLSRSLAYVHSGPFLISPSFARSYLSHMSCLQRRVGVGQATECSSGAFPWAALDWLLWTSRAVCLEVRSNKRNGGLRASIPQWSRFSRDVMLN